MPTHLKPTKQPTRQQAHPHPTRFDLNLHMRKVCYCFSRSSFPVTIMIQHGVCFGLWSFEWWIWKLVFRGLELLYLRKEDDYWKQASWLSSAVVQVRPAVSAWLTHLCKVDLVFNIVNLEFGGTRILEFWIWRQLRCCCQLFPADRQFLLQQSLNHDSDFLVPMQSFFCYFESWIWIWTGSVCCSSCSTMILIFWKQRFWLEDGFLSSEDTQGRRIWLALCEVFVWIVDVDKIGVRLYDKCWDSQKKPKIQIIYFH